MIEVKRKSIVGHETGVYDLKITGLEYELFKYYDNLHNCPDKGTALKWTIREMCGIEFRAMGGKVDE